MKLVNISDFDSDIHRFESCLRCHFHSIPSSFLWCDYHKVYVWQLHIKISCRRVVLEEGLLFFFTKMEFYGIIYIENEKRGKDRNEKIYC